MKLTQMDMEVIDKLTFELLDTRVRDYDSFNYAIIDDKTIFIKVYANRPGHRGIITMEMSIKAKLNEQGKLEIVEVN